MSIDQHYSQDLSIQLIREKLQRNYPNGADSFQLAPLDQLHIGGIKASKKLLTRIETLKPEFVLDIGSGPGGLGRLVKNTCTLEYFGLDITHDLNRLNRLLNSAHKEQQDISVITADAQTLPFADNSFDLIIMQHTLLNIPDSQRALNECKRVLKPIGHLLLHEVILGSQAQLMEFPVPWADNSDQSHLLDQNKLLQKIQATGGRVVDLNNWTEEALSWRKRQSEKERTTGSSPFSPQLSPKLILGNKFKSMGANVQNNLATDAINIVELLISFETQ